MNAPLFFGMERLYSNIDLEEIMLILKMIVQVVEAKKQVLEVKIQVLASNNACPWK